MGHWVPTVTSTRLDLQVTVTGEVGAGLALLLLPGFVANGRPFKATGMVAKTSFFCLFFRTDGVCPLCVLVY